MHKNKGVSQKVPSTVHTLPYCLCIQNYYRSDLHPIPNYLNITVVILVETVISDDQELVGREIRLLFQEECVYSSTQVGMLGC